jgi:hypothetical protein
MQIIDEGMKFWTYTIEPPGKTPNIVYGIIRYYSKTRGKFVVEWDKETPEKWVKWSNNKIRPDMVHLINNFICDIK